MGREFETGGGGAAFGNKTGLARLQMKRVYRERRLLNLDTIAFAWATKPSSKPRHSL